MAKYRWNVWLHSNKLTDNPNDYVAELDTAGATRTQQHIIDRIMAEGSEVKPETIKAIMDRVNAVKREFFLQGNSVNDGFMHVTPRVTGSWTGNETFNEGKHKRTADATLTAYVKAELKDVAVDVLGVRDSGARVMLVTDIATQQTDGFITLGDDILIVGEKIKVIGLPQPDGSTENGIGVFFRNIDTDTVTPAGRLSENQPSKVIARVPATLPAGNYQLTVVTRFSAGATPLASQRTITYDSLLNA
jgi:hypothetical protein